MDCEWGRARASWVRFLFRDARATPALLEFLEGTKAGQMPEMILLAGGLVEDEDELEEIELGPQSEEGAGSEESEEEDGPAPPP